MFARCHRFGDDAPDFRRGLDEVPIGKVGVTRRGAVTPVSEQLADQGQVLAGHDGEVRLRGFAERHRARASRLRDC